MPSFISRKQLLILFIAWLAFLSSLTTRLSWSSIMPLAIDDLGFTAKDAALYVSIFYTGYALTVLPGGMLADRFGYRRVIMFSLTCMAIFTALMATFDNYTLGLAYRFLLGFFSGPLHSSCMSAIGDYFSAKQRGTAVGFYMTGTSAGITVTNMITATITLHYDWRVAILTMATLPVCVLLLTYFGMPKQCPHGESNPPAPILAGIRQVTSSRNIRLLAIAGLFATGSTWGVTNWTNLYMVKELHIATATAAGIMVIYGLASLSVKPMAGFLSDIVPLRKNYTASLCLVLFSLAILQFAFCSNANNLAITAPLLGIGAFAYSPLTNALGLYVAPDNLRGTTIGFINLFNQIGSMTAPLLLGQVVTQTHSYQTSFLVIAVLPLISATTLLFIKWKQN